MIGPFTVRQRVTRAGPLEDLTAPRAPTTNLDLPHGSTPFLPTSFRDPFAPIDHPPRRGSSPLVPKPDQGGALWFAPGPATEWRALPAPRAGAPGAPGR